MVVAGLAVLVWLGLIFLHGQFWQSRPSLPPAPVAVRPATAPKVAIIVPARDEAAVIVATLRSLLAQDFLGDFRVIVVDDGSTDGTGVLARGVQDERVRVIEGTPPPAGWSGKLWALAQGINLAIGPAGDAASDVGDGPADGPADGAELLLLTDADVVHDPGHLSALVARAERDRLDLVSEMVALACGSLAERALVPAFVYFFQLLYPFAWVNDPLRATAAAAGGTILIRREALARIGGIATVRGALIDDVALARAVKRGGRIWLGHSDHARSVRAYPDFAAIWHLVARTAYVQLDFSPLWLLLTVLGMALTFLAAPVLVVFGCGAARWLGVLAWGAMAWSYLPTLRRFGRSPAWAVALPAVAGFYLAATIGSAVNHYRGRGVRWKQRDYQGMGA